MTFNRQPATCSVSLPDAGRGGNMPKLVPLDPTKKGKQAEDLEKQLYHFVGQGMDLPATLRS